MSSDRDGFRGGGNTPVDDQADVESAAETTGEYTFSADAWYTAEASSSGGVAPFSGGGSGAAGRTRPGRRVRRVRRGGRGRGRGRTGPPARSATGRLTGRATWGFPPRTGRRGRRSRTVTTPPGRTPESVRPARTTGVRSARIPSGRTRWTRTRPRTKPA
uniref:SCO5717 family growth-regulating ATPase n=1 Tax=Streptomyces albidoflavus TaxID=1886 RepID=UPI002D1E3551|nr:SCO5717 family growth-regulating ATPase [Streptomyces albidoflavus]